MTESEYTHPVSIRHKAQDYSTRHKADPEEYVAAHREVHADDGFVAEIPRRKRNALSIWWLSGTIVAVCYLVSQVIRFYS